MKKPIILKRNQRRIPGTKKPKSRTTYTQHDHNYAMYDPWGDAMRAMEEHGTMPEGVR